MFHDVKIGTKLFGTFAVLTLATVLVGLFSVARMSAINNTAHNLAFRVAPSVQFTSQMRTDMSGYRRSQLAHILSTDDAGYTKYEQLCDQYAGDLRKQQSAYQPLIDTPEEQKLFSTFSREWSTYLSMNNQVLSVSRQHDVAQAALLIQGENRIQYARAEKVISELIQLKDEQAKQLSQEENRVYAASRWWTGLVLLGAIAVSLTFVWLLSKVILKPLRQFVQVARHIGESGDLQHKIEITNQDEIGELARSLSRMVSYLNEMAAISNAIAGGDLVNEVRPRSERDILSHAFVRMTDGLSTLVRGVRERAVAIASGSSQVAEASHESANVSLETSSAIEEVTSTMHEMTVNVQNIARSSQMQADSISQNSASIEQLAASVQRISDTASVLLEISNRSLQEARNGIGSMSKATDGLNRINSSILSAAETIDALGRRANDIGKIIQVIDDISDQSNLLALNAAIEAARAGEHGLGFAVVADEVRKLAERSAQSTKEVSELIQSIQKETHKAVDEMQSSTNIVNDGLALGSELSAALQQISNVVSEVYKFAQEIGSATTEQTKGASLIAHETSRLNEIALEINSTVKEQASGTQMVLQSMEHMRELVQRNSSGSTELAAAAEQMSNMSQGMLSLMDRFKLSANEAPAREFPLPARELPPRRRAAAPRF